MLTVKKILDSGEIGKYRTKKLYGILFTNIFNIYIYSISKVIL